MDRPELVSSEGKKLTIRFHLPTLLLIDETLLNLEIIEGIFEGQYNLPTAQTGEDAWALLEAYPELFDTVLLDRTLPDISGNEVLRRMKAHKMLKHIPVVFQATNASVEEINEGFDLGTVFYITKPYDAEKLLSISRIAINNYEMQKHMQEKMQKTIEILASFSRVKEGSLIFEYQTLEQAGNLSMLLANACPDPERIIVGLLELNYNAVEHGIAQVGYEQKTILNIQNKWEEEVNRRLNLPQNKDKTATIRFECVKSEGQAEIHFIITDPGDGFDHKKYQSIDESRLFDNHGRGIAISAISTFDELIYNEKGNQVTAIVKIPPHLPR